MGHLTEEMTNLHEKIDALHNGREAFIVSLKHGMAELNSEVADMQQGFRKNHARMAGKMKDDLKASMAATEEYVSNLKDDVADMQANFRSEHSGMADKLKDDLQVFTAGIKSTVSGLEKQFSNEHEALTGKAGAERKQFLLNVKQSIYDLKLKTADLLQDITDDLAGARRAWSGAKPAPAAKKTSDKVRRPAKIRIEPNDLTQINGIGPVMSKRLNRAGIFTFLKLASSSPEELRLAMGESAPLAKLRIWIKEARKLSK